MRALILAAAMMAASCSSPEPAYFTLAAVRGTPQRGGPSLVELRRPGLAGYLDRPEIVRSNTAYQLRVTSGERWGEPFGDMVSRVLAENLNQRLPGSSVFSSNGAISADAGATIEMDVQRLDADPSGRVQLLAQVAVSRGRSRANAVTRAIQVTTVPASAATVDYVAAMSNALGQAADQIAAMLRGK